MRAVGFKPAVKDSSESEDLLDLQLKVAVREANTAKNKKAKHFTTMKIRIRKNLQS